MPTTEEQGQVEPIQLFTLEDKDGQVSSVVPLRWCISRETAQMLQDRQIEDPQVLIVIEHNGQEMERYLVPLTAHMRYIQFPRPGKNVIHATVVWPYPSVGKTPKEVFSARHDDGTYKAEVLWSHQPRVEELQRRQHELYREMDDAQGAAEIARVRAQLDQLKAEIKDAYENAPRLTVITEAFGSVKRLGREAQLSVVVPKEMFAKQPPRWMTWLAKQYTFWNRAPRDQCDLRRRAVFTAATLPFLKVAKAVGMLIAGPLVETFYVLAAGVLLLLGMRGLDFAPLRHPFKYEPSALWKKADSSVWLSKKKVIHYMVHRGEHGERTETSVSYEDRHPALFVVNPPVVVGFVIVGVVLYRIFGSVLFVILGATAAFALGLMVLVVSMLATGPVSRYQEGRAEERKRQEKLAHQRAHEHLRHDLELLACNSQSREVSLSALPKERRTVVLRYEDFKAKVCKPFAR